MIGNHENYVAVRLRSMIELAQLGLRRDDLVGDDALIGVRTSDSRDSQRVSKERDQGD